MSKKILVIGGAGYVGSHCAKAFAKSGWEVTVFDNLSTGWRDLVRWGPLIEGDLLDAAAIERAIAHLQPDAVAHFAGSSIVSESIRAPAIFYRNNTVATLNLLDAMQRHNVGMLIFSSTCAIFGASRVPAIDEDHPTAPINPYGHSKLMIEQMLLDFDRAYGIRSMRFRYFNAAGADRDGEIGERHASETHVIPLALQGATDPAYAFTILGNDFETPDGTAIRDYIHVEDLAEAHLLGLEALAAGARTSAYNLGTGIGTSVAEIVSAVERATGRNSIPCLVGPRRPGDPPRLVADPGKAQRELGWSATRSDIDNIVRTAHAWHQKDWAKQAQSDKA